MPEEFSIEDLEKHSGLPVRTLHYYIQMGLLPGPYTRGPNATYAQEHLDRLDLILILKEMHLPLKEIRNLLDSMTPEEIRHYRDYQEDLQNKLNAVRPDAEADAPDADSSALDYIKGLEQVHYQIRGIKTPLRYVENKEKEESIGFPTINNSFSNRPTINSSDERWRRAVIADGIELHTRETRDKETLYKIYRLLSFAQSLFGSEPRKE